MATHAMPLCYSLSDNESVLIVQKYHDIRLSFAPFSFLFMSILHYIKLQ